LLEQPDSAGSLLPPVFPMLFLPCFARFPLLLCAAVLLKSVSASGDSLPEAIPSQTAVAELEKWLQKAPGDRAVIADAPFARIALTKSDSEKAKRLLWSDHAATIAATRKAELEAKVIVLDGLTMKFEIVRFGPTEKPPGGRSLFLSLHGGGGAPPQVNESQWRNQIKLAQGYHPAEGLYLAPRAPTDSWDLWHQPHIDLFFQRLVEDLIVLEDVNPNRIYILGYSAGGDGVYQLGPRMADFWAAASMMAGHPNDASPLGLRNIGFAIQVGGKDAAYHRNEIAAEWGKKLDQLQEADPAGYVHFTEIHEGKPHWMDMEDRKAIPWMEKFTRNPIPDKVIWHQSKVTHARFYWLAVPKESANPGVDIVAERHGQTIAVAAPPETQVFVRLNDAMLDLDQPVTVALNGREAFSGRVSRTIAGLVETLGERGDPELVFPAEVKAGAVRKN
jgi:hypothetical protein